VSRDILHRDILHRKAGATIELGKKDGAAAALLRNQLTFLSSHPARWHFEHNSNKPLLHAFFDEALYMDIDIPIVVGVAIDVIITH
jgi:hypothetical protein